MARAFWFSLLIGYLAGAFAAAIYLPRAILAPSLSNLLLLTVFSALFISVVTWRAWQERSDVDRSNRIDNLNDSVAKSAQENEIVLDLPLAPPAADRHDRELLIGNERHIVNRAAPIRSEPLSTDRPHAAIRSRNRVQVVPQKRTQPEVICLAEPLMQMPSRRLLGRGIGACLSDEMDKTTRNDMLKRGLSDDSILEFDRIVWSRLSDWLSRKTENLGIGRNIVIDLHLSALRSRKFRSLIDNVVQAADLLQIQISIVLSVENSQNLPRLKAKSIGQNVSCFLRMVNGPPPITLLDKGFHGVVIDRSDLTPFLQMPLNDDPVFKNLTTLDDAQARIIMRGFASEADLRDVFDYPCHWACGPLFGDSLQVTQASGPQDYVGSNSTSTALSSNALRGHAGYQFASTLDDN